MLSKITICAGIMLACVSASGAARADLTIVSQTKQSAPASLGEGGTKNPLETTVNYYQKHKVRTETGETVSLYDGDTNTTLTLYPNTKTYTETKGTLGDVAGLLNALSEMSASARLDCQTVVEAGDQSRTIAGLKTRNYHYISIWTLSVPPASPGAAASDADDIARFFPATLTIQGEAWAAEKLGGKTNRNTIEQMFDGLSPTFSGAALKTFVLALGKIKGVTLDSTKTITLFLSPAFIAASTKAGEPLTVLTQTTGITETKSISKANLDAALFTVPADYKKVDAHAAPPAP